MQEKELLQKKERVYLNHKELVTSKNILRSISPDFLNKIGGGGPKDYAASELSLDDERLAQEIGRLNSLL